jgi:hypothetical protein
MGQTQKDEEVEYNKTYQKLLMEVVSGKITIQQVPEEFQDFQFLEKCILKQVDVYQHISEKMKENHEIATLSILKKFENYNFIPESLKKDEYFHIRFLQRCKTFPYQYFNENMKKNPNIAIEAMKQCKNFLI